MSKIEHITIMQMLSDLPEARPLGGEAIYRTQKSLLIAAGGFEARARFVAEHEESGGPFHLVLITYPTNEEDNMPTISALRKLVPEEQCSEIPYDRDTFRRRLREPLFKLQNEQIEEIVIDVSGMSSFIIYPLILTLVQEYPDVRLRFVYVEANEYHPTQSDWDTFYEGYSSSDDLLAMAEAYERTQFQSHGVNFVYESPNHPGSNPACLPTHIIAIPNFSRERMMAMIAFAESRYTGSRDRVTWIIGDPPDRERNQWRRDALLKLYQQPKSAVPVSTLHYKHLLRELEKIWEEKMVTEHMVIATLGSKMQHIATAMFFLMHPDVGLILCEPKHFEAKRFSEDQGKIWILDCDSAKNLEQTLRSKGKLIFSWEG